MKKTIFLMICLLSLSPSVHAITWTNLIIDSFNNADISLNNLNGYCEAYADNGNSWLGEGGAWGYNGTGGMASSLTNTGSGFYYYYLSILSNAAGGYQDVSDTYNRHALRFYMINDTGAGKPDAFQLEKIQLKDSANTLVGEVNFSNYNNNTGIVPSSWKEYVIPFTGFSGGSGDLTDIKTLIYYTAINQSAQYKISQVIIVRGVEISAVSLSNTTTGEKSPVHCDLGDVIRVKVEERSNVFGCAGYVKFINASTSQETIEVLQEVKNGSDSYYYADFTPTASTRYDIDTVLTNAYGSDKNGSNNSGYDASITTGSGLSSLSVKYNENTLYQAVPGEAYLYIPAYAFTISKTVTFKIKKLSMDTGQNKLYGSVYLFLPFDFKFQKPVTVGLPAPESGYGLFTYNGYEWIQVPGSSARKDGYTYLETDSFTTGIFAVFKGGSTPEDKLRLSRRTFSPNQDGVNDEVIIYSPVPAEEITGVSVYDLKGRLVKNLDTQLIWDGKNANGHLVQSNVYIIKLTAGGRHYYQTVTVVIK